ncbi:histone-lysine N-methyltransferase SETDB1-like [Daktulosphaira vitifoliae]|uniref:histone-lysine N-methyltransferase SETDB1-like n=1 Tax=Daktulosphaira vitifoliae TaxID=58002 RepID=UPI0021AA9DE8|nr:histone-lysine N-methyltransferase SETDB1-like [Daktulosphaira vitifoliae]XP_050536344.1 histone-lysine N-methyltransferase SETDB1-like [Daktulosphaira vitifoliae]
MASIKKNRTSLCDKQVNCVNRRCKSGEGLSKAIELVCSYYHVEYKPNREVCVICLKKCLKHFKNLETKMKAGECIMDGHFPNYDSYCVIESDDEDETLNSLSNNYFPSKDIVSGVNAALDLYFEMNEEIINDQIVKCNNYINKSVHDCTTKVNYLENMAAELENEIAFLRNELYKPYQPITSQVCHIDVIDDLKKNDKDIIAVNRTICSVPADLPNEGPLQYPHIKEGEVVYAMKFTLIQPWYKCKIKSVVSDDYVHAKFEDEEKLLPNKAIASFDENPVRFPVGSRVISKFTDQDSTNCDYYYAGVIAEPPNLINQFRYMVFFDDGYVQYRQHKDIRLIRHKCSQVWNDVHQDSKEFIYQYLKKYPERQMVRLNKKHFVRAENQNQWLLAKVLEVDASLVKLYFMDTKKSEWMYRGSSRLWNIFEQQTKSEKGIRVRQSGLAYLNKPFVEYTSIEEDTNNIVKSVARKSTTKSSTTQCDEEVKSGKNQDIFKITNLLLPASIPHPKTFIVHNCNFSCIKWTEYDYNKTKLISMLATPLYFGFVRYIAHFNSTQKCVMYKTPCGRTIRNMKEMHDYLLSTKSKMTVDQFDFNSWVNPLVEFKVLKSIKFLHDLSGGKEFRPITCVNNINHKIPPNMDYITERRAKTGVNLNVESSFLCGCDCTDNCQDKSKCACWQMTIDGQKILPNLYKDPNIGYNYRRLPERVLTGIYECNKTCKCSSTCINRVVQNPLSQKLQLFATEKKGWGVRCLNDIPQGSFICIYVGNLLTESDANEGGKNYGDEYLAELDYIEVVEKIKEDYESDVPNSDAESESKTTDDDESYASIGIASSDEEFQTTTEDEYSVSNIISRLRKRKTKTDNTKTKKDGSHVPSKLNAIAMENNRLPPKSIRDYYGDNESVYIMDAKSSGNIGRYLNHSCNPNTFVQNVFVDTHDLRFPWVSFFALHYIPAGSELTWDYSYEIGSVPGKVMKCHCESAYCRGRLL